MTLTILVGPADMRAPTVAAHMLAEGAALRTRLQAAAVAVRLVCTFDPAVVLPPGPDGQPHPVPDLVLEGPPRPRDQWTDGITSAGLLSRELAQVATDGSVHAIGWRAAAVAVTARTETGVPVVAHADQLPSVPGDERSDGSVMARLGWATLASADRVVVDSSWAGSVAVRRGVPRGIVVVLGPSVTRVPDGAGAAVPGAAETATVLSVGDPADVGSLRPVAEAVLHHPGARLLVARGTGLDDRFAAMVKERLRELPVVRRLGSRCQVAGPPAASLCGTVDLVVDVSGRPGRGLGILAAMFESRAVVASSVGGAEEMVEEGVTGLLVEPRDRVSTRDAVAALLRDPARLLAYGAAGRERAVTHFDPVGLARQVVACHGEVREQAPEGPVDVRDGGPSKPVVVTA